MQFASAHIHLASHHEHDGHDHYHSQLVHAHNVASHHVDAFDLGEDEHSTQVVELSQDWLGKHWKNFGDLEHNICLNVAFPICETGDVDVDYIDEPFVQLSSHFHSKVRARAPPASFTS